MRRVSSSDGDAPVQQRHAQPLMEERDRLVFAHPRKVQRGHAKAQVGLRTEPGASSRLAAQMHGERLLYANHVLRRARGQACKFGPLNAQRRVSTPAGLNKILHTTGCVRELGVNRKGRAALVHSFTVGVKRHSFVLDMLVRVLVQ